MKRGPVPPLPLQSRAVLGQGEMGTGLGERGFPAGKREQNGDQIPPAGFSRAWLLWVSLPSPPSVQQVIENHILKLFQNKMLE